MFVCLLQENKELKKMKSHIKCSQHGKCVAINVCYESSWIKYSSKCNTNSLLIIGKPQPQFFSLSFYSSRLKLMW
jgi:hypothetical protein